MNGLPYIDQHSIELASTPERAWPALLSVIRTDLGNRPPAPVLLMLKPEPELKRGDWRQTPRPGDSLPGFQVAAVRPFERLALEGRHRFSRYALVFELEQSASGCILTAQSWAEFPGLTGRLYRAAVIGTRGHRIVVRRLLARVARRA